jgi:hypothetical protein
MPIKLSMPAEHDGTPQPDAATGLRSGSAEPAKAIARRCFGVIDVDPHVQASDCSHLPEDRDRTWMFRHDVGWAADLFQCFLAGPIAAALDEVGATDRHGPESGSNARFCGETRRRR